MKNKKVITFLAALVISANSFAQAPNCIWAKAAGGTYYDYGYSVATDACGNVYVTGSFSSPTITFGTTTLTNAGSGNIFIAKYDAAGTVLWAKREGGTSDDVGLSVATDASGNVYVTGYFTSSTITFGTTTLTNAGGGSNDMFIVKYDAAGNVLWAKREGGTSHEIGFSVTTDASGNVYVTGEFISATITFGTTTLTNAGGGDIFIAKYDAAGTVLWAKRAAGTDYEFCKSVTTDASGNVYVTGEFRSPTITFGTTTLINAGNSNIFIAKYDAAGTVLWAKGAGSNNDNDCRIVTTDASGNVYVTGVFTSPTITFGTTTLTNAGSADMFIAKYDDAGTVLWAKRAGGADSDYGYSVATDASGNVFVTGSFLSSTITFGTTTLTNAGSDDIFIAKYDSAGTIIWAKRAGGTNDDYGISVTTDASGNVYVTGRFASPTITFGTNTLTNSGSGDIFIVKYDNMPIVNLGSDTTQCGGTVTLDAGNAGSSYLWSTGATTQTIMVSVSGNYSATVTNAYGSSSDTVAVTIDALPTASTISAGGATALCPGNSVILSGNVGGTWSTGASTSSITVLSAGTYSVTNTNSCGSTTSNAISTTVNPSTFLPDFVASQTNLIASPFNLTFFNTTPNTSTYSYKWWFGDGSSSQAVDPSHIFPFNGLYTVSLIAIDSITGCSDTTTKANYIVCTGATNPCTQTANISPIGTTNRCVGGSVLYTCTTNAANPTYQWNINGVPIGGATQSTYPATVNGVYTVTVYTNGTCPKTSASVTANFNNTAPTAPTISQTGAISGCSGGIINLNASNGFTSYLWSNGATAQNINITTSGNYYVIGTNSSNCTAQSNSLVINPSYLSAPEICLVTVDTVIDKNLIAWDKSGYIAAEVDSFIVMKEGIYAGVYNRIGAKSYNQLSEFTDVNSNALARADRYKIAVKDSCGNLTLPSGHYKTMHLQITPGNGLQRNLSWSHAEGIPYAFYYRINRWHQGVWATIDSVQSNLNTYTDLNVPDLNVDYIVEIKLSQPCTSSKSMQAARVSCTSNSSTNRTFLISPITVGISEVEQQLNFNIYPNPAKDLLNIEVNLKLNIKDLKLKILDVVGKLVMNETISNQHTELNIQYLNKGIYFVRVGNTVKKLVVD